MLSHRRQFKIGISTFVELQTLSTKVCAHHVCICIDIQYPMQYDSSLPPQPLGPARAPRQAAPAWGGVYGGGIPYGYISILDIG